MRKFICMLALLAFLGSLTVDAHARPRGWAQKRQNAAADRHDLTRLEDRSELQRFVDKGLLVEIASTDAYVIDDTLGEKDPDHRRLYRYARPWTKSFLDREIGAAHDMFGTRYVITSLVRTRAYQKKLCRSNGNAICGAAGWRQSSHLTGATVDISRVGLSRKEEAWLRSHLNALQDAGKILYIPERSQYCFHIMVLPSYGASSKASPGTHGTAKASKHAHHKKKHVKKRVRHTKHRKHRKARR